MKKSTLCFCLKNDQVLLAMKKRGFGIGKWNGYGGKVTGNEAPVQAAVRELEEESGLVSAEASLQQVGLINFYFDEKLIFECHVFFVTDWRNEPIETDEMRPQWYQVSNLPFDEMWAADTKWIPLILNGSKIKAEVKFNEDGTVVKGFLYEPMTFS